MSDGSPVFGIQHNLAEVDILTQFDCDLRHEKLPSLSGHSDFRQLIHGVPL